MKRTSTPIRAAAAAAAALVALALAPAGASELSEIQETQKKILERLDAQDKTLQEIMRRLSGAGMRAQPDPNKVYEIPVAGSAIRGPKDAKVTLVEFADFQCPFCAQSTALVDQVLAAYPKDVRFVYKNFPLEQIHPNAMPAAKAVIAAGNQGKYWEMYDELYKITRELTPANMRAKAEAVGLDLKRWEADMAKPETEKQVREELALGRSVDVQGTPTFFLNGKKVQNRSLDAIKAMIDAELAKKKG